jgi:O-antigen ligase
MINVLKLEGKLRKMAFWLGVLCLASVILILPNILRPFILAKMLPFQTFSLFLTAVWVILMILDFKKYRPRFNWLTIAVTIFYVIILLSSIFSLVPYRSFWGNAERMEGFISLFHFYLFFLALSSIFYSDKESIKKLVFTSIVINFVVALFPILELLKIIPLPSGENLARPGGVFGNPTFFAGFLLVHLFLMGWYYLVYGKKESQNKKIFLIIGGIVSFIVFLWVQTRGSILGFLAGLFVALVASIFLIPNKKYKKWSAVAAGIIVVAGILFIIFQPQIQKSSISKNIPVVGRLASISLSDTSTRARLLNWQRSFEWWKQRPILGYGQDMFYQVFDKNYTTDDFALSVERFDRAHNKFFDVLVMNGIVGLLAYLFLLGVAAYLIIKKIKKSENITVKFAWLSILGLFVSYLVHNFFVFDTPANSIFFYFFLAFLNVFTADLWQKKSVAPQVQPAKEEKKANGSSLQSLPVKKIYGSKIGLIFLVLIVTITAFYYIDFKPYKAAKLVVDANRANFSNLSNVSSIYQKAVNLNTFLNTEIKKTWGDYFYSYLIYVEQGKIKIDKNSVVTAYEQIKDNLISGYHHEPMVDFYIYLANISYEMSNLNLLTPDEQQYYRNEAEKYFEYIADNWPKHTDFYIRMVFYSKNEKLESWLNRILQETPKYGLALWTKAAYLLKKDANAEDVYNAISQALENGYQFSLASETDLIYDEVDKLVKLREEKVFVELLKKGIAEEENILAHQKLNAFEKDIHSKKLKSLIDFTIFVETIDISKNSENIPEVIGLLEKANYYQPNRPEILLKLAAAHAYLHDKEKAIEYAQKVIETNKDYAEQAQIFINLVEEERWDEIQ